MSDLNISNEEKKAKDEARKVWDSWIEDLQEKEQPEACQINDPDCENCGS
jgi:hypothetical protein